MAKFGQELSLKEEKERFVTGHSGTSMLEISSLSILVTMFVLIRKLLLLSGNPSGTSTTRPTENVQRGVLDFFVIVFPTILTVTVLSDHLTSVFILSATCLVSLFYYLRSFHSSSNPAWNEVPQSTEVNLLSPRKQFLSHYRTTMLLSTCIMILAVDFPAFPRRFAKTETFGTGLMDIGVGSFVFVNGLVSRQARGSQKNFTRRNSQLLDAFWSVSPLLALGGARLCLTKGVNYQEHVGEYGVHWNFFFTLAAVVVLTSAIPLPSSFWGLAGVIVLSAYQFLLSARGWSEYLVSDERENNLFSLNKEGIMSSIGYWGLYLISVEIGRFIFALPEDMKHEVEKKDIHHGKSRSKIWWIWTSKLFAIDLLLWIVTLLLDRYVERVSRRTCNITYAMWTTAQNLQVVLLFLISSLLMPSTEIFIYESVNKIPLPTFLLANILTGVVNLSIDTIKVSSNVAIIWIVTYMATVAIGAVAMSKQNISLKFW